MAAFSHDFEQNRAPLQGVKCNVVGHWNKPKTVSLFSLA